jgi:hypothetical protein
LVRRRFSIKFNCCWKSITLILELYKNAL